MNIIKKLAVGALIVGGITYSAEYIAEPQGKTMIDMNKKVEQRVRDEKSFDEKATEFLYNYNESPVGTESPYDREDGSNPVYEGMMEEEHVKPDDSKTPFYNTKTGQKVVEDNVRKELDERKNSPNTATFESPFSK